MSVHCQGLTNTTSAADFYDDRYRHGYMENWSDVKRVRVAELITEFTLPETGVALDFGCGAGVFTAVLRAALPKWEIHGTDISAEAMSVATSKLPDVKFHRLSDCPMLAGKFDLVFSHHVLEHVSNLSESAELIGRLLKPCAAMFHIMPCGDPGSLEHTVCTMRRDGIQQEFNSRFFFEEIGHLRRLTTAQLINLWSDQGFRLEWAGYANQYYGALESITDFDLRSALNFSDPRFAVSPRDAGKLRRLRFLLVAIWVLRHPMATVRNKLALGCNGLRDRVLLATGIVVYPISKLADWIVRMLALREWTRRRKTGGGSEMYIFLVRR